MTRSQIAQDTAPRAIPPAQRRVRPFRQRPEPEPQIAIDRRAILSSAYRIRECVRGLTAARGGVCYVFVDQDSMAYVIAEDRSIAQHWLREHSEWLVGAYDSRAKLADVLAGIEA